MEERKLNEQESLELIARMIQNTKKNVSQNVGGPTLVWGYATVITSLIVYVGWTYLSFSWIMWGWFLIPVLGSIGNFICVREKNVLTKTYLDRVIKYIWLVIGLVAWAVAVAAFIFHFPILFFIALLMATAITLTGCVTSYKTYIGFGIAGILLSFLCLVVKGAEQILVFAGIFVIIMIIPGYIMNAELKKVSQR